MKNNMILFALAGLVIGGALGYWYGTQQAEDEYLEKLVLSDFLIRCCGEGPQFLAMEDDYDYECSGQSPLGR